MKADMESKIFGRESGPFGRVAAQSLLATLLLFLGPGRLWAELSYAATPEWLAHEAALAFVGVPQRVEFTHRGGECWVAAVQFRIDRRIKGPLSVGDVVTVRSIQFDGGTDRMGLKEAVARKREVLVLATVAENSYPETDGSYLFLKQEAMDSLYYADEPVKSVYSAEGKAIRTYSELLQHVIGQGTREADLERQSWRGEIVEKRVEAEVETDAVKDLYNGSAVILLTLEYREPGANPAPSRKPGTKSGGGGNL